MDSFSNGFTSSNSIKRSSVTDPSFNDVGGNNENEFNQQIASKLNKELPTKHFMSHTICTANKATVLKKKVLSERNETLDVDEQPSLRRSSSFDSKTVKSPVVNDVEKPYDPINNYLSPRPKFLRYNPDRRRKISVLQGNEESVRSNDSFDVGSQFSGIELGVDSSGIVDSCSQKESVEQSLDVTNNEGECEEDEAGESEEEEEEEEIEIGEHRSSNLKGFFKFLVAVIAVIFTAQAICSMNSPTPFHTVETWSSVYEVTGFKFSEVRSCVLRETDFVVGRLKEVDMVESFDGVHEDEVVSEEETSVSLQELGTFDIDVENDEVDVIHGEISSKEDDTVEITESEVMEIREVESEREIDDQTLVADFDEDEETLEHEIAEEMKEEINDVEREREVDDQMLTADSDENEEIAEGIAEEMEEINDSETIDVMIKSETFDLNLAVLIGGFMLILTSFGVMYRSKRAKSPSPVASTVAGTEKEEIRVLKPVNPSSLMHQTNEEEEEQLINRTSFLKHDVSEEVSHIHAPSVELLGEFVFGEEANTTTVFSGETKSSQMDISTGDSVTYTEKTVKKQRRKNVEATTVITPSPVRRSSRLQNRSIKSP